MEIFKILDGRKSFYQWDLHQKLLVMDDTVTEVHFPLGTDRCPPIPVYEYEGKRVVDVPNVLLQTAGIMHLYAFVKGNDGERTICSHTFRVNEKRKPDDYIYTEKESWTTEEAVKKALREAKESGDFNGETSYLHADIEDGCLVIYGGESDDIDFEINSEGELEVIYG